MANIFNAVITDDDITIPKSELVSEILHGGNLLLAMLNTVFAEADKFGWTVTRSFSGNGLDRGRLTFSCSCNITLKPQIVNMRGQLNNNSQLTNSNTLSQ